MVMRSEHSEGGRRIGKSAAAFRTISEVADDLEVPPHVLRFWETKFAQVKPLKRGGGRRYYRPEDIALLRRIRELLYRDGYTIKGVQKLLRDGAVKVYDDGVLSGQAAEDEAPEVVRTVASGEPMQTPAARAAGSARAILSGSKRTELRGILDELTDMKERLDKLRRGDA